ncbi:MAG: hypothetical protein PHW82_15555 [Bacteroidales bacterium]|nr:hypothetical protein [Bacteroidales bacterium]
METYLIDKKTIGFLEESRNHTGELKQLSEVISSPKDFAKKHSIALPKPVEKKLLELGKINESKGYKPDDPINKEIMSFFNKVLIDGRFIEEWTQKPENVAKQLGITVSREAIERITSLRFSELVDVAYINDPSLINKSAIVIVIVIVLVVVFVLIPSCLTYSIQEIIVDPKSLDKV